ncbi:uncharacterized protein LOC143462763 [Clavelina lepadiformis]|uniref:uncharacterized protein LOC143462763 n=1 Tax=Clavelina lepadiformis TaxID=159417 RepID=UPI0040428ED9
MLAKTKENIRPNGNFFGGGNIPVRAGRKQPMTSYKQSCVTSKSQGNGERLRQQRKFPTNYRDLIRKHPPALPAALMKIVSSGEENLRKKEKPGTGKVKIMLRLSRDRSEVTSSAQEFLRVEDNRKNVSVFVPDDQSNGSKSLAPKVYAFDSVFTEDTTQTEICATSLHDVIQGVLQGADGTVLGYGQANLGKTYVLMGKDKSRDDIGLIPCAISWLYRCLGGDHEETPVSVKVSAVEVYGRTERLRDLLVGYNEDRASLPGLYFSKDPLLGTQLTNLSEIKAGSADRAAYLLDAALAARSCSGSRNTADARRHSHMIFTLHLYHQKQDLNGETATSLSRLNFVDLGSCEKTLIKTTNSLALSLSSLGHVIMAIVNNSKHVPFKESKLTCLLRESLGNVNCRVIMLAHVSRDVTRYSDTLSTIQMASRIHRVWKRRWKSSTNDHGRQLSGATRMKTKHLHHKSRDDESMGSSSGMELTSGSELSCDTVVYVNTNGVAISDRELTDNEGPPESVPIRIPPMIAENSPPGTEEMVYNIAQARVHKLVPVRAESNNESGQFGSNTENLTQIAGETPESSLKEESLPPGEQKHRSRLPQKSSTRISTKKIQTVGTEATGTGASGRIPSRTTPTDNTKLGHSTAGIRAKKPEQRNERTDAIGRRNPQRMGKFSSQKIPAKSPRLNAMKCNKVNDKSQNSSGVTKPTNPSQKRGKVANDGGPTKRGDKTERNSTKRVQFGCIPTKINKQTTIAAMPRHNYENILNTNRSKEQVIRNEKQERLLRKPKYNRTSDVEQDQVSIPSVQRFTENIKNSENVQIKTRRYENVVIMSDYPTADDVRPEPLGCDNESQGRYTSSQNSCSDLDENSEKFRPDSLFVNVDEDDWSLYDDDDDDAVQVNFYCLTFTSKNPLIPLSKMKFRQEVTKNKMRMSSDLTPTSEASQDQNNEEKENDFDPQPAQDCDVKDSPMDVRWAWREDVPGMGRERDPDVENEDFDSPKIEEMHKIGLVGEAEQSISDQEPQNDSGNEIHNESSSSKLSSASSQAIDDYSVTREVCLYDSNSLEMSYVSTKQSLNSSVGSPSRSSSSSQSPNRCGVIKDSEVRRRTSRPIVMSKSTSREGARLTLVKRNSSGAPKLELLITKEKEPNPLRETMEDRGVDSGIRLKSRQTSAEENRKKSRWLGLRRKKSASGTGHVTKQSLVGKLFATKSDSTATSGGLLENGDNFSHDASDRRHNDLTLNNAKRKHLRFSSDVTIEQNAKLQQSKEGAVKVTKFGFSRKTKAKER